MAEHDGAFPIKEIELRVYAIKSGEMIVIDLNENAEDTLKKEFEEISNGIEKFRFECNPSMDLKLAVFQIFAISVQQIMISIGYLTIIVLLF